MTTKHIKNYKKTIFAILISVSLRGLDGKAAEPQADRRVAAKIAKEKGILKPKEVLEWKIDQKDIPKDWNKIDNKYFNVSFPKCFNLQGDGGEDDPKIAPSIIFSRSKDCPGFVKENGDSNWFNIGISIVNFQGAHLENNLQRQNINLNDYQAISLIGLMDHHNEIKDAFEAQLRWQIYVLCKGKTFEFGFDLQPGKPTMDLVEKNKYEFPEDFKKIVSTFKWK